MFSIWAIFYIYSKTLKVYDDLYLGLLPVYEDGDAGKFKLVSWKTASSLLLWTLLPIIFTIHQIYPWLSMIINGSKQIGIYIPLGKALIMYVNLFALPIVRTKLVVNAKITLDAKGHSKRTKTDALTFLLFATGMVLQRVLSYTELNTYKLYLLSLAIPAVLAYILQIGTSLLVFSIATNEINQENKMLESAISSKDLFSAYTKLISKYKALQNSCGALLFVLCFDLGLKLMSHAWITLSTFEITPLPFVMSNGLIVVGAFSLLSVLTTLAHDAYAGLFLHQRKLR